MVSADIAAGSKTLVEVAGVVLVGGNWSEHDDLRQSLSLDSPRRGPS